MDCRAVNHNTLSNCIHGCLPRHSRTVARIRIVGMLVRFDASMRHVIETRNVKAVFSLVKIFSNLIHFSRHD